MANSYETLAYDYTTKEVMLSVGTGDFLKLYINKKLRN